MILTINSPDTTMEKHKITIVKDKEVLHFDVADYLHHDGERCKFEVYQDDRFVASFEPDPHHYLHVCKNAGVLDEETLHLIADQLELLPHEAKSNNA